MATSIFLGYPPPYIEQWYKNPHPTPVLTGATWFNYYDGTSQSAYITAFSNEQIPGDKEALTRIDFGEACTGISPYSFEGCTSLTSLDLGRADISIYEHALEYSSVMYLTVDGKDQYISENALVCDYLQQVSVISRTVDEMLQNSLAEYWGVGEASDGTLYQVTVNCADGSFVTREIVEDSSQENSRSGDFNPRVFYIRAVPGSAMASLIGDNWLDVCYNPQDLHTCLNVLTSTYNLTEMDVNNGTQDIIIPSSLSEIQSEEIYWYFSNVRKIMVYGGEFLRSTYRENMFSLDYLEELYLPDLLVEDVEIYASTWGLGWNYSKSAYNYVDVFCGNGHIGISGGQPA